MRVMMLLLIALAIGACTTGVREVGESQLKERVGVQFEVTDGQVSQVPFTGRLKVFYDDGTPREETHYKDGKKEGLSREWYENGQLMRAATFKDGKGEGLDREWYENGQLEFEETVKNGSPEGLSREWYENGQLESEETVKNGRPEGLQREWHENGQLKFEETRKNGRPEGLPRRWHENGQLKSENTWKNDRRERLSREWHDNGQLMWAVTFKDGEREGLQREWHDNGQLKFEETWKNGRPEGLVNWWHENGQLKRAVTFKDGKKEGLQREWYENGQLAHEWCYANDEWVDMAHYQSCSSVPEGHANRPVDQDIYYLADRPVDHDDYYRYHEILLEHFLPLKADHDGIAFTSYDTYPRAQIPVGFAASLRTQHRDGEQIIVASVRQIEGDNLFVQLSRALDAAFTELDLVSQISWTERELYSSDCPELTELWEGARKLEFPSREDGEIFELYSHNHARKYEMAFNSDFRRISFKGHVPFFAGWIDDSFAILESCDSQ